MERRDESIRAWLTLRLRELAQGVESNLDELASGDKHHLADLEELASDVSADGVVFEQVRSNADMIAQIQRALQRLDAGTYETCEQCGGTIGWERLDALPFATQCIACKRNEERFAS